MALQSRLDIRKGESKQLDDCHDNLRRVAEEKMQLKERLRLQEEKLTQQKAMVNNMSTRGQPSITSTVSDPVRMTYATRKLC